MQNNREEVFQVYPGDTVEVTFPDNSKFQGRILDIALNVQINTDNDGIHSFLIFEEDEECTMVWTGYIQDIKVLSSDNVMFS